MGKLNKYPVSREVCEGCSSCILVTETIAGHYLSEEEQYHQCISDMEWECSCMCKYEVYMEPEVNPAWTKEDQEELDRMYPIDTGEYIGF